MPDLLFEVGLEEIPARMIAAAQAELAERIKALLTREGLLASEFAVESFSTPRRLAVRVSGILAKQVDVQEILTGPASSIAFKNSEPTPAAYAFAKKAGVDLSALSTTQTPKGEYVTARVLRQGLAAASVLAAQLPKELGAIYWAKNMYWRAGKPERFVRPLRWLLALLDSQVIALVFAGTNSGNKTYGHRILHGNQPVEIAHPAEYLAKLEAAYVSPVVEWRRHRIRKALDAAARAVPGRRWREDHALVDAVTHLVEWPTVILGSFEREYLSLPEEVLVTVMRDHQKYFALEDQNGRLSPYFLAVLNTQSDLEGEAIIRHGNERVLRARFNDAKFFWDVDQKIPLTKRVEMLKSVTFQKQLGSYYDKTEANLKLAEALATTAIDKGVLVDEAALLEAVRLAKTDLTTELVKEFTELQGIVGGRYAEAQGSSEMVARAIYSQYRPASPEEGIPDTAEGQLLGLADRLSAIYLMFSVGLEPTGSKDPFALRRAGNSAIRIMAESHSPLGLAQLLPLLHSCLRNSIDQRSAPDIYPFLRERLRYYLEETGKFSYDIVSSLIGPPDSLNDLIEDPIIDLIRKAESISVAKYSEDFIAISSAFRRIKNILRQATEKGNFSSETVVEVDGALLTDPAEQTLYAESTQLAAVVDQLRRQQKYSEALEKIATLRPHVDHFFDKVMVMAPEAEIRRNRLALIASVLREFSKIADFSEIVVS